MGDAEAAEVALVGTDDELAVGQQACRVAGVVERHQ